MRNTGSHTKRKYIKKNFRDLSEVLDTFLHDKQFAAEFLSQALEEEDFATFLLSIKDVIRVQGTTKAIAEKSNISRTTLHKLISGKANPEMKTVLSLVHTLGYELRVTKRDISTASRICPA